MKPRVLAQSTLGWLLVALFSLFPLWSAAEEPVGIDDRASYDVLADILEDDDARAQLIEILRERSTEADAAEETEAEAGALIPGTEEEYEISFARRVANASQHVAENFVAEFSSGVEALRALGQASPSVDMAAISAAVINLVLLIVGTLLLFLVLRRLARPVFAAANRWARGGGTSLVRNAVAIVASAILDFLVIVLAYIGGFVLALYALGEPGEMDARESLFLNAFLVVEVFKAVIRILFASRDEELRILPMTSEQAAYWNAWLARLSGFIGYGILLVVPMVNFNISPALGRMVALVIMGLAFLYALVIILQNRVLLTERIETRARKADLAFTRLLLTMLSKSWFLLAIAYFATLAVMTVASPEDALPFMLGATLQTVIAIGVGLFVSVLLSQFITRGFRVADDTRERFPMLENRLNSYLPTTMKVARLAILIVVAGFVADAWGLFSLAEWAASEAGGRTVRAAISVAIILSLAMAIWIGMASWIEQRLNPNTGEGEPSAREVTLLTIFRNAIAITLIIITLMIVLAEIGINIGPLIAGAGVLGLAIGFGAQKLVQDIITGVFIQMENAINTGDIVTVAGISGTAEKLTIRSLAVRDLSGTYHLIPFSSVDTVSNYMREFAYHVGEYGVAYREDIDEVMEKLREAFQDLISDPDMKAKILDEIEVHGVTALADSSINIRIRIKTLPGTQWGVGRAYNRLVKYHLDAAGIEIPFPHLTMYFGQDKDGTAPPAPILVQNPAGEKPVSGTVEKGKAGKDTSNAKDRQDWDDAD